MNKLYFVSGFPRSGNTLLTSILDENPNITATGHSWTTDIFHELKKFEFSNPRVKNYPCDENFNNVYKNIFKNFYSHIKTDYVIERGEWITPFNYEVLKKYCPNEIKIVILVRDILDIVKSYLKICKTYPNFYINNFYKKIEKSTVYLSEDELKADLVMDKNDLVHTILYSIKQLKDKNILDNFLIVDYDDLIKDTNKQLNRIYDYFEIPRYKHNLKKITQLPGYDDEIIGAPIHTIKTKGIEKENNNIKLSKRTVEKYKNLEFWK